MDEELYDEFGNYIGPEINDNDSDQDQGRNCGSVSIHTTQ